MKSEGEDGSVVVRLDNVVRERQIKGIFAGFTRQILYLV